jgi:hypothetical protein
MEAREIHSSFSLYQDLQIVIKKIEEEIVFLSGSMYFYREKFILIYFRYKLNKSNFKINLGY